MSEPNIPTRPDGRLTRWLRKSWKRGPQPSGRDALWASKDQRPAKDRLVSLDVFRGITLALQFLALCYWLIDLKGYKAWTKPFVVFGVNAIVLFAGTGLMARILGLIKLSSGQSLQGFVFGHAFSSWLSPINASLAYAIAFILLWLFLMWLLYRKRIIIKI